jgi:hypothetical protein
MVPILRRLVPTLEITAHQPELEASFALEEGSLKEWAP